MTTKLERATKELRELLYPEDGDLPQLILLAVNEIKLLRLSEEIGIESDIRDELEKP